MDSQSRYAIYYVPKRSDDLGEFGSRILGRDCETGEPVDCLKLAGISRKDCVSNVGVARRYGFHATLKAPFRLCAGVDEADLFSVVESLTQNLPRVEIRRLELSNASRFLALRPIGGRDVAIEFLASEIVRRLDYLRAPLSVSDLEKRVSHRLTDTQRENLACWGYPFVFESFRFHFTLSDRLLPEKLRQFHKGLIDESRQVGALDLRIERIAIVEEEKPGADFVLRKTIGLGGPLLRAGDIDPASQ